MFLFPVADLGFQMTWKQEDLKAGGRNCGSGWSEGLPDLKKQDSKRESPGARMGREFKKSKNKYFILNVFFIPCCVSPPLSNSSVKEVFWYCLKRLKNQGLHLQQQLRKARWQTKVLAETRVEHKRQSGKYKSPPAPLPENSWKF